MGFPFFAPLQPWIIDMMNEREDNPHMAMFRNPFVVMTSGALVTKAGADVASDKDEDRMKRIQAALSGTGGQTAYKGCIISNNINNKDLSYSANETNVGVDFEGKYIKVEGETGRKVSTPIIESVDIDTDGANNTLKTAKVTVRCFTLKQFEMFELFFMKPGMNVLVEWGDSSLMKSDTVKRLHPNAPQAEKRVKNTYSSGEKIEIKTFKNPEDCLVHKTETYDEFCTNFSRYYRSDTTAIAEYLQKKEQSNGSYDLVAGKVLDYSFSINDDGTYTCNIEVSQGNQVSLAIPHNARTETSKDGRTPAQPDTEFNTKEQIIQRMIKDFNLDSEKFRGMLKTPPEEKGDWENDWFNFVKINKEQKDTVASDVPYVSFRFVLKVLLNYVVSGGAIDTEFFKLGSQEWKTTDGKTINIIPVTSNKWIMSSNNEVIYPRKGLPTLKAPAKDKDGKSPEGDANEITLVDTSGNDCTIGGYDYHTTQNLILPKLPPNEKEKDADPTKIVVGPPEYNLDERVGNALNIFIKYETVVKAWKSNYTRIDFLDKILSILNNNSYGMFMLVYGVQRENSVPTIIDYKFAPDSIKVQNSAITYRFKPTTLKSIVKQFTFNFEMSNLVAGRTIFNSGKFLAGLKSNEAVKGQQELPAAAYKSIDNSTYGSSDGWYSINNVELKKITANYTQAVTEKLDPKNQVTADTGETKEATKEAVDMTEVVKSKSINFIINEKVGGTQKTLIYNDGNIFQDKITKSERAAKAKKPSISPIEVSITIDGFSGFTPGQYFNIDGIPEIYNQLGVFQITNTKHNISKDGWATTIEAQHRVTQKT